MGKIVQQQTAHRDLPDVCETGGGQQMIERGIGGMEGQRNEGLKAAGIVLHGTQAEHVIDTVLIVLDVPVKHGGVGAKTQLVGRARSL